MATSRYTKWIPIIGLLKACEVQNEKIRRCFFYGACSTVTTRKNNCKIKPSSTEKSTPRKILLLPFHQTGTMDFTLATLPLGDSRIPDWTDGTATEIAGNRPHDSGKVALRVSNLAFFAHDI